MALHVGDVSLTIYESHPLSSILFVAPLLNGMQQQIIYRNHAGDLERAITPLDLITAHVFLVLLRASLNSPILQHTLQVLQHTLRVLQHTLRVLQHTLLVLQHILYEHCSILYEYCSILNEYLSCYGHEILTQ